MAGPGAFEDAAFSLLLDVAEGLGFKVSIYKESVRFHPDEPLSIDGVVEELAHALRRHSESGAFLKIGGVPVVFIYNIEAYYLLTSYWSEVRSGRTPCGLVGGHLSQLRLQLDTRSSEGIQR
ncbi:MAG: hypothetical protein JSV27_02465 [Candidatus Bathyarchaeota archaeon]|nr:MAG: hypothetical protein JSV27_02465 [Candidatus Bathyarchaeota archaeon]